MLNTYSYSIGDSVEFTPEQMKLGTQILAAYLTHMLEICKVKEEYGHPVSSESMLNEKLRDMRFVFDAVRNIEKFVGRVPDEAEIVVE
ncbi:hypothetical protein KA013_01280 [Patescibacteria group bacterium]|nr:hypothetical protein [Patescibacteria group bacterium]